jgi:hypothetical protein
MHARTTAQRRRERAPQRCCELCAALLEPLQAFLIAANAAACQPPVHDALDAVCLRSWLNQPWGSCMADEVFKAANIVRAFTQVRARVCVWGEHGAL